MKKRILIIEDENSLRGVLKAALREKDFDVLDAPDGVSGLEVALREHPDLILLDLILPKMDGVTFLRSLRDDAWGSEARVVVLTNSSDPTLIDQTLESNVFMYIVKDDSGLDSLVRNIQVVMEKK